MADADDVGRRGFDDPVGDERPEPGMHVGQALAPLEPIVRAGWVEPRGLDGRVGRPGLGVGTTLVDPAVELAQRIDDDDVGAEGRTEHVRRLDGPPEWARVDPGDRSVVERVRESPDLGAASIGEPGTVAAVVDRAPHVRLALAVAREQEGHGRYHRQMATLSRADVEHVAHLARLGLTEDELDLLEGQLNHILDQYAILATVPTDHIAPTAQTIELENILRDDVVRPSLTAEQVLANAAEHEGDFIVVPAILGGEG